MEVIVLNLSTYDVVLDATDNVATRYGCTGNYLLSFMIKLGYKLKKNKIATKDYFKFNFN